MECDRELSAGDPEAETFVGLPKSESQPWMHRVVEGLVEGRRLSLPVVVRRRHELATLLRGRVATHGRAEARTAAAALIAERPHAIEASAALVFEMNERSASPARGRRYRFTVSVIRMPIMACGPTGHVTR